MPDSLLRRAAPQGALSLASVLLGASVAIADPCCVDGLCEDLTPAECELMAGIPGHCDAGLACAPTPCSPSTPLEIDDLRVFKAADDLLLTFTRDPVSNLTRVSISAPTPDNLYCEEALGPPPVDRWSTIDELPVAAAGLPPGDLLFLCAVPACYEAVPPSEVGACCQADGSCNDDVTLEDCHDMNGFYQGDGTTCAASTCGVVVADATPCLFDDNVLYMNGVNGDWVHPGEDTILDATWNAATTTGDPIHTLRWRIVPDDTALQGNYWSPEFSTRELGHEIRVGVYEDAQRAPFADPGHPGLNVTGDHRGCNRVGGRFQILECVIVDGEVIAFSATWHQECEPAGGTDYMDGCLRVKQ